MFSCLKLTGIFIAEHANDEEDAEGIDLQQQQRYPWEGSDRDYIYDEVSISLDVFFFLHQTTVT